MTAPTEFHDVELDGMCETILCYDSRDRDGYDLADKEIAYLLHKHVLKGRQLLTIFDSCHSGTISKGIDAVPKQAGENSNKLSFQEFEGATEYGRKGNFRFPPQRNHITLSACRDRESAVELNINEERRSLFTYCLLETLRTANLGSLSYEELTLATRNQVVNWYPKQTVYGEAIGQASMRQLFLEGKMKQNRSLNLMCDKASNSWFFLQGELQGVSDESLIEAIDAGDWIELKVTSIGPSRTSVAAEDWMNSQATQGYVLRVAKRVAQPLMVSIREEVLPKIRQEIIDGAQNHAAYVHLVPAEEVAGYEIGNYGPDRLALYLRGAQHPVFAAVPIGMEGAVAIFLSHVGQVGRYWGIQRLRSPVRGINLEDLVDVRLEKVLFDEYGKITKTDIVPDLSKTVMLTYQEENGQVLQPGIRLSVRVKKGTQQRLYAGLLFLDETFLITDQLLPHREINAGDEWYTTSYPLDRTFDFIPLSIPESLRDWGVQQIDNYCKLIVATSPFVLRDLVQEGLPLQEKAVAKGGETNEVDRDLKPPGKAELWVTQDITLRIHDLATT
jgi:hypothetical protein